MFADPKSQWKILPDTQKIRQGPAASQVVGRSRPCQAAGMGKAAGMCLGEQLLHGPGRSLLTECLGAGRDWEIPAWDKGKALFT